MRIPEVRERLDDCAEQLAHLASEIRYLKEELKRRPAVKRAAPRSAKMTKEKREEVFAVYAKHPEWTNRQIGNACNVDGARVSEIIAGRRD